MKVMILKSQGSACGQVRPSVLTKMSDQEPNGHSDRAPALLCEERRTFQKDKHPRRTPPIRPVWYIGQTEATPQ